MAQIIFSPGHIELTDQLLGFTDREVSGDIVAKYQLASEVITTLLGRRVTGITFDPVARQITISFSSEPTSLVIPVGESFDINDYVTKVAFQEHVRSNLHLTADQRRQIAEVTQSGILNLLGRTQSDLENMLVQVSQSDDLSTVTFTRADGAEVTISSGQSHGQVDIDARFVNQLIDNWASGAVSGNTEVGIAVTYQGSNRKLDFIVDGGAVARMFEALSQTDKLDYNSGLKNKPTIPTPPSKATQGDVDRGTDDTKYMSVALTLRAISNQVKVASTTQTGTVTLARNSDVDQDSGADETRVPDIARVKRLLSRLVPSAGIDEARAKELIRESLDAQFISVATSTSYQNTLNSQNTSDAVLVVEVTADISGTRAGQAYNWSKGQILWFQPRTDVPEPMFTLSDGTKVTANPEAPFESGQLTAIEIDGSKYYLLDAEGNPAGNVNAGNLTKLRIGANIYLIPAASGGGGFIAGGTAPDNAVGENGDYALNVNSDAVILYRKADDAWVGIQAFRGKDLSQILEQVRQLVSEVTTLQQKTKDLEVVEHTEWANVPRVELGGFYMTGINDGDPTSGFGVSHRANARGRSNSYSLQLLIPTDQDLDDFRLREGDNDITPVLWSQGPNQTIGSVEYKTYGGVGAVEILPRGTTVTLQKSSRNYSTIYDGDVVEPTREQAPATKKYVDAEVGKRTGGKLTLRQQLGLLEWYQSPEEIIYTSTADLITKLTRTFAINLLNANLVTEDCWVSVECSASISDRVKLDTSREQIALSVNVSASEADTAVNARLSEFTLQAKFWDASTGGNQIGEIRTEVQLIDHRFTAFNIPQRLTAGANVAWDVDSGNIAQLLLGQNTSVTISGGNDGDYAILTATQDATGGNRLVFRGISQGAFGITQPKSEGNAVTHYVFFKFGTTWTMFYNSNAFGSQVQALGSGSSVNWNLSASVSDVASLTIAENFTFTMSGGSDGQTALLRVTQDSTGGRTIQFATGAGFKGTAPTLSTGAGAIDVLAFHKIGNTWHFMGIRKNV